MTDYYDFSRLLSISAQPRVAPSGRVRHGLPPLPVGEPVIVKNPTPSEAAALAKAGWDGKSAVPSNMHEFLARLEDEGKAARAEATSDVLDPPVDLNSPALVMPGETDIRDLPPEQQQLYQGLLEDVWATTKRKHQQQTEQGEFNAAGMDPSIIAAIQQGDDGGEPEVINDLLTKASPPGPPVQDSPPAPATTGPVRTNCQRCGHQLASEYPVLVTEQDFLNYVQTFGGTTSFVKTFTLWKGELSVTLRTLFATEIDLIYQQLAFDERLGRIDNPIDRDRWISWYRAALQLVEVARRGSPPSRLLKSVDEWAKGLQWQAGPEAETPIRLIWKTVSSTVLKNSATLRTVVGLTNDINFLEQQLEFKAQDPNFSLATASST